jgi:hypothetical protein
MVYLAPLQHSLEDPTPALPRISDKWSATRWTLADFARRRLRRAFA